MNTTVRRVQRGVRSAVVWLTFAASVCGGLAAPQLAAARVGGQLRAEISTDSPAPILNVPYATASPSEELDIYPSATPNSPLVMWVHGGAWHGGDKSLETSGRAAELQSAGFTVFDINYRLDSTLRSAFPMQVQDVNLATKWAIANAAQYNADPTRVTQIGGSAGGQLVGMSAEDLNAARRGTVRGVVTLSGIFDFQSLVQDAINGTLAPTFTSDIGMALGCSLSSCTSTRERAWSPSDHVTATDCPSAGWMVFNSDNELVPVDQPAAMTAALQRRKCKVTETILSGTEHAGAYWEIVKQSVIDFINAE